MANVPKFGNWATGDQVPYTVCFENARRRKGGAFINPNDPRDNPSAFEGAPQAPNRDTSNERQGASIAASPAAHVTKQEPLRSAEELTKPTDFPGQLYRGGSSDLAKRGKRDDGGGERTPGYASPQPYYEERAPRKDGVSVIKNSSDGGQRLKNRTSLRTDNVGTGPAIPKFGAWNEADPSAAVGYTGIFDKVRVEKLGGAAVRAPAITVEPQVTYNRRQEVRKSWIRRCFGI
ncbi:unnamed protein product [Victoria cruziana]